MPGCVLHVHGEAFDPAAFLATASLQPYDSFRKGDRRFPQSRRSPKVWEVGGFKCLVSDREGDLAGQVADAIAFLTRNHDDLVRLSGFPVESAYLDFGYDCRLGEEVHIQCEWLPPELLRLAGKLGLAIELSLYPALRSGRSE